ncbi:MAG: porin [Alphaproteobacteria bacterium]|nr:porin [Alphaproteobacteria bacterium]
MNFKKLMGTIALVGLILPYEANAAEQQTNYVSYDNSDLEFSISGHLNWALGVSHNSRKGAKDKTVHESGYVSQDSDDAFLWTDAEIDFSGKKRYNNGNELSFVMQLDTVRGSVEMDEVYFNLDTDFGRFMVGNKPNVAKILAVTAPDESGMGINDSDAFSFIYDGSDENFAINPSSYPILDNDSAKINYLTPEFKFSENHTLVLGVSAMPSDKGMQPNNSFYEKNAIKFKYGASSVAYYEAEFGKYTWALSADYTWYKAKNKDLNIPEDTIDGIEKDNIYQYGFGTTLSWGNWSVGGTYSYVNMSQETAQLLAKRKGVVMNNGYVWTAGISHKFGPLSSSLSFIQSRANNINLEDKKDVFSMGILGLKYTISKGVSTWLDLGYAKFDSAEHKDNKSPLAVLGLKVEF